MLAERSASHDNAYAASTVTRFIAAVSVPESKALLAENSATH